jgi:hypothetical protein
MKNIRHFKSWNSWRKHNRNNPIHKILVLFGIVHSPTFWYYYEEDEKQEEEDDANI